MNWKKDKSIGVTTQIDGCKVSRVDCNSGVRHYYVDNILLNDGTIHWDKKITKFTSLAQVRREIKITRAAAELMNEFKRTGDV